jgi:chemotaxis protein MotB
MLGTPPYRTLAVVLFWTATAGCSFVPKSRLDECHKLSRGLQTEVAQLRDAETRMRAQYRDLVERSVNDQRRLAVLENHLARQERTIRDYQDDRERLAAELDQILRVVRGPSGLPTSLHERLGRYAQDHPGVAFHGESSTCRFPLQRLFTAGSDVLTPLGADWLRDLATTLADFEPLNLAVGVQEPADPDPVQRVSFSKESPDSTPLGVRRAERVRRWLSEQGVRAGRIDRVNVAAWSDDPTTLEIRVAIP